LLSGQATAADSLREIAEVIGIPGSTLSKLERQLRNPSAVSLRALAAVVSFSGRSLSLVADLLEQQKDESRVIDAIKHDLDLNPRQRTILIQLYQSFVRANR